MKKFDLHDVYHEGRPMSWSAISSFEWNPNQWFQRYVLKEETPPTPELIFGAYVDKRIQNEPDFLPSLIRYPVMQHEMRATFNGIPLIGYSDAYDYDLPAIRDYKTGRKEWTQKRADETGQLTLYTFFLYLMYKIQPSDVKLFIDWMPTHFVDKKIEFLKEGDIHTFQTSRSMQEVLEFAQRIERTWTAMQEFGERQSRLLVHDKKDW